MILRAGEVCEHQPVVFRLGLSEAHQAENHQ